MKKYFEDFFYRIYNHDQFLIEGKLDKVREFYRNRRTATKIVIFNSQFQPFATMRYTDFLELADVKVYDI